MHTPTSRLCRGVTVDNEVTAKLLADFSQQLDRKQPITAVKAARPSRLSMEGYGSVVAECKFQWCICLSLTGNRSCSSAVSAHAGRGDVLRDQSNLDLTSAAARTPGPPAGKGKGKGPGSPTVGTDSAHRRPRTGGAFSARQNSGQVVAALNDHLALDGQVQPTMVLIPHSRPCV